MRRRAAQPADRAVVAARLAAALATLACALPVAFGFAAPAAYLACKAWQRYVFAGLSPQIVDEAANTALFAAVATVIAVGLGLVVTGAVAAAAGASDAGDGAGFDAGYAVPGTILAIGLLPVVTLADRQIDAVAWRSGATGRGFCCWARGGADPCLYGAVSGHRHRRHRDRLSRRPPSLDHVARTLGRTPPASSARCTCPIARPALAAAGC